MFNTESWSKAVVTDIAAAVHVDPANHRAIHKNRPYHGLVLNETNAVRDYYFSDGTVMHTSGDQLFYLPKGSSYRVYPREDRGANSCYAINFHAEISDSPFVMSFRDTEHVLKLFKRSSEKWRLQGDFCRMEVIKDLYAIIIAMGEEQQRKYIPTASDKLIAPAVGKINAEFLKNELTVAALAEECGITESYFRRLFTRKYGVSPKEYIIRLRMGYAKDLLSSGDVSITEAAEICGYAEVTHFSREFSKRVGVPPRVFKIGEKI